MNLIQLEILFVVFLPGFAITFLIGWHRSRGKPNFFKITFWAALVGAGFAAIVCASLVALFFYMMGDRVVDHYTTPLTVEQARQQDCPIPLPDSARNVQFVHANTFREWEILVRFEAPVEVCKSHVQIAFDALGNHHRNAPYPLSLVPLEQPPSPEDKYLVGKAPWFDVEKIKHGLKAENGSPARDDTVFWIDEDRGVFYCKITD